MNSAGDKTTSTNSATEQKQSSFPMGGASSKEQEVRNAAKSEHFAEVSPKMEIPKEVEQAGVTKIGETIELPPSVGKLGVTHAGPSVPVVSPSETSVKLPISDQQVLAGQKAPITDALRWLATWCVKQLKKAHLTVKVIKGRVVRVKTD